MSACMFWHKWSKWSDPERIETTNWRSEKITVLVQSRNCLRCNITERRTVTR